MVGTIRIHGSDEVMAPLLGPGGREFHRARRVDIKIIKIKYPEPALEALVGLTISTIFDCEQLGKRVCEQLSVPSGSRMAYIQEVVEALVSANKLEAAKFLTDSDSGELALYVFQCDEFVLV